MNNDKLKKVGAFARAILVIGYNNTRAGDVLKIRDKAKKYAGAVTVLCKPFPQRVDYKIADFVIDVGLDKKNEHVQMVISFCSAHKLEVVGVLPFSDQGTQLGSLLATYFRLPGPCSQGVSAALDKSVFRNLEKEKQDFPAGYQPLFSQRVHTIGEVVQLFFFYGPLFIKPTSEGNSRGCFVIRSTEEISRVWPKIKVYLAKGVIVEVLVEGANEYSVDHVNGYTWVTEKKTTGGHFRVELQQIVPAPLSVSTRSQFEKVGHFISALVGGGQSAFHNEVFHFSAQEKFIAVEPNIRPAGMKIWDLAAIAFKSFDPWGEWVKWATQQEVYKEGSVNHIGYAGIRMIVAPKSGVLMHLPAMGMLELDDYPSITIHSLEWTKTSGDEVVNSPSDNSEFIGYVIASSPCYTELNKFLTYYSTACSRQVEIS